MGGRQSTSHSFYRWGKRSPTRLTNLPKLIMLHRWQSWLKPVLSNHQANIRNLPLCSTPFPSLPDTHRISLVFVCLFFSNSPCFYSDCSDLPNAPTSTLTESHIGRRGPGFISTYSAQLCHSASGRRRQDSMQIRVFLLEGRQPKNK